MRRRRWSSVAVLGYAVGLILLLVPALGLTQCINRDYGPPCQGLECSPDRAGEPPNVHLDLDGTTTISDGVVTTTVGPDRTVRGFVIDGGDVRVDVDHDGVETVILATESGHRIRVQRDGTVNIEDGSYMLTDGTAIRVANGRMSLLDPQTFTSRDMSVTIGNKGMDKVTVVTDEDRMIDISPHGETTFEDGTYRFMDGTEVLMEGGSPQLPVDMVFTTDDGSITLSIGNNGLGDVLLSTPEGGEVRIGPAGELQAAEGSYTLDGDRRWTLGGTLPEGTLSLGDKASMEIEYDVADHFAGRVETPAGSLSFQDGRPTGRLQLRRESKEYIMELEEGDGTLAFSSDEDQFFTDFDRRGIIGGTMDMGKDTHLRMERGPLGRTTVLSLDIGDQQLTFDATQGPSGALAVNKDGNSYALDLSDGIGSVQLADGAFDMSFDPSGLADASIQIKDDVTLDLDLDRGTGTFDAGIGYKGGDVRFSPDKGFSGSFSFGEGDGKVDVNMGNGGIGVSGGGGGGGGGQGFDLGFDPTKGFTGGMGFPGGNGDLQFGADGLTGNVNTPFGTAKFGPQGIDMGYGGVFNMNVAPDGAMTPSLSTAADGAGESATSGKATNICTPRLLKETTVSGGGGSPLDPSLTDCDLAQTATNLREHADNLINDFTRAIEYYSALVTNLETMKGGFDQWCSNCMQSVSGFMAKGYVPCGGKLAPPLTPASIAADPGFRPTICAAAAMEKCPPGAAQTAQCTASSMPNPLAKACPLCLTLNCVYGHECKIGFPNPAAAGSSAQGEAGGPAAAQGAGAKAACGAQGAAGAGGLGDALGGVGDALGQAKSMMDKAKSLMPKGGQPGGGQPGGGQPGDDQPGGGQPGGGQPGGGEQEQPQQQDTADNPNPTCSCSAEEAPICGTDGRTYFNSCLAGCFGIEVAHEGECETWCTTDADCVPDRCCTTDTRCTCVNNRCRSGMHASLAPLRTTARATPMIAGFSGLYSSIADERRTLPERPATAELQGAGQCIPFQGKMSCNSAGAPDSYDVPPPPIGSNMNDLGVTGCTTKGAPQMCTVPDCIKCQTDCLGKCKEPAGCPTCKALIKAIEAPRRNPPIPGACTNHNCCGPPFNCQDMNKQVGCPPCKFCGVPPIPCMWLVAGCVPETHDCADVTQATLVTKMKQNSIPSPGGVRECEQNVADLKDVCTVEGSPELASGMLDPCAVGMQLGVVIGELHDLIQRMSQTVATLSQVSGRLGFEHSQGFSDRKAATIESSIQEISSVLEGASATVDFQVRLANFVRLAQNPEFNKDIMSDASFQAPKFDILPKAEGSPAQGIWSGYCTNYDLCAACTDKPTPAGCLGRTSKTSYKPNDLDYRGRCMSKQSTSSITERSFDIWQNKGSVDNLASIDAEEDLFIDMMDCYKYDALPQMEQPQPPGGPPGGGQPEEEQPEDEMPPPEEEPDAGCVSICKGCYGVDRTHCHTHLGVCVCEAGKRWFLTSRSCEPGRGVSDDDLACCERFLSVGAEVPETPSGEVCSGPVIRGVTVDRCIEGTGLCCKYRFQEISLAGICDVPDDVDDTGDTGVDRSCDVTCKAILDRDTAEWCARRCPQIELTCEQECLRRPSYTECLTDCSPAAADCMTSCMDEPGSNEKDCVSTCTLESPTGAAEAFVGRPGGPSIAGQVFASGDSVQVGGVVNNTGDVPLEGTGRLSLVTLTDCTCDGSGCTCSEEVKLLKEFPVRLGPGEDLEIASVSTVLEQADTSVQVLVEVVDEDGKVLLSRRSTISHVVSPGAIAVRDAYFVDQGGRTDKTYPGTSIAGAVTIESIVHPITVVVSLVKGELPVIGTSTAYTLTGPTGDKPLLSGTYTALDGDVGKLLRIHVVVRDSGGEVLLDRILDEQGVDTKMCGSEMTGWCLIQLGKVRPSYSSAFAEVRRLQLEVRDAAFMNFGGRRIDTMYGSADIVAIVWLRNPLTVQFSGQVVVRVVKEDGTTTAKKEVWMTDGRVLDRGDEETVQVEAFSIEPPTVYSLWVTARDNDGRTWLDDVVNVGAFPHARLAAATRDPSAPGTSIDTVIGIGSCQLRVSCEGCSPLCELHVNPRTCVLKPYNCDCDCIY